MGHCPSHVVLVESTHEKQLLDLLTKHHSSKSAQLHDSATWGADNSSIIRMVTGANTNPLMTAAEKGGLISKTSHFSQEYWASPLSKASLEYSNS